MPRSRFFLTALALVGVVVLPARMPEAEPLANREVRCLGMVAYAEAAVDGVEGMAAVIRVVRNRMADPRFPRDACAVIAQALQFQPIAQSTVLQRVVQDPEAYNIPQVMGARSPYARRMILTALHLAAAPLAGRDPTGGALYFVNPSLMDPDKCPWFAALRRTARIGSHVFMTPYAPDEPRGAPALDCREVSAAAMRLD